MIDPECFSPHWIDRKAKEIGYPDKNLVEKVIRAFSLLDMLSASGCPFKFKGGSSLMLLLKDQRHRLSIDIDIICPPGTDLEKYLTAYRDYGFIDYDIVSREQKGTAIPKSHSKFFYQVSYKADSNIKENILLDVLNEDCHYNEIIELPIESQFLKISGKPNKVQLPSIGDILGDKLTAFAPNTTGIPYEKKGMDRGLDIMKQLYDIARLFDRIDNLETTSRSFDKISKVEMAYRNIVADKDLIFEDIRNTALCITTQGHAGQGNIESLLTGISRIKPYMYNYKYDYNDAVRDASIAAYIGTCLQMSNYNLEKYNGNPLSIKDMKLSSSLTNRLNRFKRFQPEAFYYWVKTSQLLER